MKDRTGPSTENGAVSKKGYNGQYSKNMQRLGGMGLSLYAFANSKSRNKSDYNPAIIKRKREFYKNAKFIRKFKKSVKHDDGHQGEATSEAPVAEERDEAEKAPTKGRKKYGVQCLEEVYKKKREYEEKVRQKKEAELKARKEEKIKAEQKRKFLKEKMFKKTRSGQPVMKYRIEQILETLQESEKKALEGKDVQENKAGTSRLV